MKVLITGGCGFVGTNLSLYLNSKGFIVHSLDNLSRKGSKYNLTLLKKRKIKNFKINIENFKFIQKLPKYDLIIDCCAEAAVEVSRKNIDKVINTNLIGTLNILKKIQKDNSKIIFLSTSRVFPISETNKFLKSKKIKSKLQIKKLFSEKDIIEGPKTIYGLTKLSSEMLIEEFSYAFNLKYIINRCGVISGPLQFGKQDQGFLSMWLWRHLNKIKINYQGFGGFGHQIRDILDIKDLCFLIKEQISKINKINNQTFNVGGSINNSISLVELTNYSMFATSNKTIIKKKLKTSNYDLRYYVTDNKKVYSKYKWRVKKGINLIIKETLQSLVENKKYLYKIL